MVSNQRKCFELKQMSILKCLQAIRNMCDVYGEVCFSPKKMFTNGTNME